MPSVKTTLTVTATDIENGQSIAGLVVGVAPQGTDVPDGIEYGNITTPGTTPVAAGGYLLTVISVPDAYRLAQSGAQSGTAIAGEDNTVNISLVRRTSPNIGITIYNLDRLTNSPLVGAQFTVHTCEGGTLVGTVTTTANDGSGDIGLVRGCYTIIQTKAAAGYLVDPVSQHVEVREKTGYSPVVFTNLPADYVMPRNPEGRVPIKSIPSGRIY